MNRGCFASLLLILSWLQSPLFSSPPYTLVVCALFQNEQFFLKEWLDFHKEQGVEHFFLYDNESSDDSLDILKPYIEQGVVDLISIPIQTSTQREYLEDLQLPCYRHALSLAKEQAQWVAFLDLDEFLFPIESTSLKDFLKDYKTVAGLAVNWQVYGTSWIDELPENQTLLESLVLKADVDAPINQIFKMIVQPKYVKAINNPHFFEFHEGFFAVDSNMRALPLDTELKTILIDKIRINHYWTGTLSFFQKVKIPRRKKWGFQLDEKYCAHLIASFNEVFDDAILMHTPNKKTNKD